MKCDRVFRTAAEVVGIGAHPMRGAAVGGGVSILAVLSGTPGAVCAHTAGTAASAAQRMRTLVLNMFAVFPAEALANSRLIRPNRAAESQPHRRVRESPTSTVNLPNERPFRPAVLFCFSAYPSIGSGDTEWQHGRKEAAVSVECLPRNPLRDSSCRSGSRTSPGAFGRTVLLDTHALREPATSLRTKVAG